LARRGAWHSAPTRHSGSPHGHAWIRGGAAANLDGLHLHLLAHHPPHLGGGRRQQQCAQCVQCAGRDLELSAARHLLAVLAEGAVARAVGGGDGGGGGGDGGGGSGVDAARGGLAVVQRDENELGSAW
jgi:uncharacterized membrane protein YgcG